MERLNTSRRVDQTKVKTLQVVSSQGPQIFHGLDALRCHEYGLTRRYIGGVTLPGSSLEGDPEAKFEETTFEL